MESPQLPEVTDMKKITAIIRPEKLEEVKTALEDKGFFPMTIKEVRGRGAQKGSCIQYRGKQIMVDTIPKIEIYMVVSDEDVRPIIDTIKENARTGKFGDGKIFVSPVETVIGIRTGDEIQGEGSKWITLYCIIYGSSLIIEIIIRFKVL
jgi:nitrogen regulatory protein P-II 1